MKIMKLGVTIKKMRQQRNLTQEQLAEYLSVSVSAVSQWESGKTIPDVLTILSLAGFFNVSLDELFDRQSDNKKNDMDEYYRKTERYRNQGETQKDISLWREAVVKYPGDFRCLSELCHSLFMKMTASEDSEKYVYAKECVQISTRILNDCTDNDLRSSAIQTLVFIYSDKSFEFADESKAVEYAMMAQDIHCSREVLLESAYFDEKEITKIKQQNILTYMDMLTMNLTYRKYSSVTEKIRALNAALSLWSTLIYDGNYLFYHCRLTDIYIGLAFAYAEKLDKENTISNLKKAMYHADSFDNLRPGEQYFTSIFVSSVSDDPAGYTKNYGGSLKTGTLKQLASKSLDFLRSDSDFLNLLQE